MNLNIGPIQGRSPLHHLLLVFTLVFSFQLSYVPQAEAVRCVPLLIDYTPSAPARAKDVMKEGAKKNYTEFQAGSRTAPHVLGSRQMAQRSRLSRLFRNQLLLRAIGALLGRRLDGRQTLVDRFGTDNIIDATSDGTVLVSGTESKTVLNLKSLDLTDAEVSYLVDTYPEAFKGIQHIDLTSNDQLSASSIIKIIKASDKLLTLALHGSKLGNRGNNQVIDALIEHQPNVSRLYLQGLTASNLGRLAELKKLLVLDLGRTNIVERRRPGAGREVLSVRDIRKFEEEYREHITASFTIILPNVAIDSLNRFFDDNPGIRTQPLEFYEGKNVDSADVIIDGDTIKGGGNLRNRGQTLSVRETNTSFRFAGIDTAETPPDHKSALEIKIGVAGKNFASAMIDKSTEVRVVHIGPDKYNQRELADIFVKINGKWLHLNGLAFVHGVAREYWGDSRAFVDWKTFYIDNQAAVDFWTGLDNSRPIEEVEAQIRSEVKSEGIPQDKVEGEVARRIAAHYEEASPSVSDLEGLGFFDQL